jgi:carboxyl-terminal processing protease
MGVPDLSEPSSRLVMLRPSLRPLPSSPLQPAGRPRRVGGRSVRAIAVLALTAVLSGCGGGGSTGVATPTSCSLQAQKDWVGRYMDDTYLWEAISPRPDPAPFDSADAYLQARLYEGNDPGSPGIPADRFSRSEPAENFQRFYGEGRTLGYGISVAGIEVRGQPEAPLFVRWVEPQSDGAARGVRRGDRVLALNGRPAAEIIDADDFSALVAEDAGEQLRLQLRDTAGVEREVTVTAGEFALTPVPQDFIVTTPQGRRLGVVLVKDMIEPGRAGLQTAFQRFRNEGVDDLVLDLRYNGGGLVSFGGVLASYAAGSRGAGRDYAVLRHNARRAASDDQRFPFENQPLAVGQGQGLPRVFVLTGSRTCSASEQVINGLRGVGIEVVTIGGTSCGKPVGSRPSTACGRTYSVINFESLNALGQGRYFDGFEASCPVAEDFTRAFGDPEEPLLRAAMRWADNGLCVQAESFGAADRRRALGLAPAGRPLQPEPGERRGMIVR